MGEHPAQIFADKVEAARVGELRVPGEVAWGLQAVLRSEGRKGCWRQRPESRLKGSSLPYRPAGALTVCELGLSA